MTALVLHDRPCGGCGACGGCGGCDRRVPRGPRGPCGACGASTLCWLGSGLGLGMLSPAPDSRPVTPYSHFLILSRSMELLQPLPLKGL